MKELNESESSIKYLNELPPYISPWLVSMLLFFIHGLEMLRKFMLLIKQNSLSINSRHHICWDCSTIHPISGLLCLKQSAKFKPNKHNTKEINYLSVKIQKYMSLILKASISKFTCCSQSVRVVITKSSIV